MAAVQGQVNAALIVDFCGGAPIDVVGADDAGASTYQRIRDAAVLISITANRQHRPAVQDEYRHAGSGGDIAEI